MLQVPQLVRDFYTLSDTSGSLLATGGLEGWAVAHLHHNDLGRWVTSQVTGLHPDLLNEKSGVGPGACIPNMHPGDSFIHTKD